MKSVLILLNLILFFGCSHLNNKDLQNSCVPDEKKAIIMADSVWIKLYGDRVKKKKPYKAKLINDSIWVVKGTIPKNYEGGFPYIEINAKNCAIIKVTHSK